MRIQTFSIVAGSEACNARCPFCISKMTVLGGMELKEPHVNWRNFRKACRLAEKSGCTTVMFTGKGEPTLFPRQITHYLEVLQPFDFPLIEIQTNGIKIAQQPDEYAPFLDAWYGLGMTTIAISIVHYEKELNKKIYLPYAKEYIDLPQLITMLHHCGFSVRLTCILAKGFIDSPTKVLSMIGFAREHKVEQLTLTPVNKPDEELSRNKEAWSWTDQHYLGEEEVQKIKTLLETAGAPLNRLAHGAIIFDFKGQNVCLNNCLSVQPDSEDLRNLIFFPDGHLRYYWQYDGAILL